MQGGDSQANYISEIKKGCEQLRAHSPNCIFKIYLILRALNQPLV
jgi:hypothetical protein